MSIVMSDISYTENKMSNSKIQELINNATETAAGKLIPRMPVEVLGNLERLPIQRNEQRRVKRKEKIFSKSYSTLAHITIIEVKNRVENTENNETISIEPGFYLVDGYTRRLYWQNNPDTAPIEVSAMCYEAKTYDDVKNTYYSFDNASAVERSNEIVASAMTAFGIRGNSNKVITGQLGSALRTAYPGDDKDSVYQKVSYFKREIEFLDKVGIFSPSTTKLGYQVNFAFALAAAKAYGLGNKRMEFGLRTIATAKLMNSSTWNPSTNPDKVYGLEALIREYLWQEGCLGFIPQEYKFNGKYTAVDYQMDVMAYLFSHWMEEKEPFANSRKAQNPQNYHNDNTDGTRVRFYEDKWVPMMLSQQHAD